jgi:hypothetical protein
MVAGDSRDEVHPQVHAEKTNVSEDLNDSQRVIVLIAGLAAIIGAALLLVPVNASWSVPANRSPQPWMQYLQHDGYDRTVNCGVPLTTARSSIHPQCRDAAGMRLTLGALVLGTAILGGAAAVDLFAGIAPRQWSTAGGQEPPSGQKPPRTAPGTPERPRMEETIVSELRNLAALHAAGALTNQEFADAKARVIERRAT